MNAPSRLHHLASRVRTDPFFLGHALAAYQAAHGLDDAALARFLGLDRAGFDKLSLCRMPRRATWTADLDRIAQGIGCEYAALVAVLEGRE